MAPPSNFFSRMSSGRSVYTGIWVFQDEEGGTQDVASMFSGAAASVGEELEHLTSAVTVLDSITR